MLLADNPFQVEVLFEFLLIQNLPISENRVIKHFIKIDFLPVGEDLFKLHFALFNALYHLKKDAGAKGYYLHLDPFKLSLVKVPDEGCLFFSDIFGKYCGCPVINDRLCEFHSNLYGNDVNLPAYDYLRDYYLDPANYENGYNTKIKKIQEGMLEYSFNRKEFDDALNYFGLKAFHQKEIINIYHAKAKLLHPDKSSGDKTKMRELNEKFQLLKELFV